MRFIYIIFFSILLIACVKQPNPARHYAHKHSSPLRSTNTRQSHASFWDFFSSKPTQRGQYAGRDTYTVRGQTYKTMKSSVGYREKGIASWYGKRFHQQSTSSGERYNMYAMTAAHRTLPLHSYVKVTNLKNGRSVVVRVNDRGPFHSNRVIDLSYAAARGIGILPSGMATVELQATSTPKVTPQVRRPSLKKPQKPAKSRVSSLKKRPSLKHRPNIVHKHASIKPRAKPIIKHKRINHRVGPLKKQTHALTKSKKSLPSRKGVKPSAPAKSALRR
jgi:rare lipoprotein A